MKLMIYTQVHENYGTDVEPFWKPKGGEDYVVKNFVGDGLDALSLVKTLAAKIETDDSFIREYIIGHDIVEDDFLTEFERSQLEYDGAIVYPSKEIVL